MRSKIAREMPGPVAALLVRITSWRENRKKRTAMPEELWRAATQLGRKYGAYPVARDLNLHYERLKRRVQGLPSRVPNNHGGFIELRTMAVSDCAGAPSAEGREFVTEVEVARAGGVTLRVRQTGPEGMDVVGLAAACFGRT
jgi:hypothetical protein